MRAQMTALFAVMILATSFGSGGAEELRRSVTVSAQSEVKVVPDEVAIDVTIALRDLDLMKAKAANDRITQAVLKLAAAHGLPADDVRINNLDVTPQFDRPRKVLLGYDFERSLEILLHDFSRLEPLLQDLIQAGVDRIDGMHFRTKDQRKHQFEARRLAVEYAKEKASHLAELNGLRLGKAVRIEEDVEYNWDSVGFGGFGGMTGIPASGNPARIAANPKQAERSGPAGGARAVRLISFEQDESPSSHDDAVASPPAADPLLALGLIRLNAIVTIEFEMLPNQ